jgi:hypothetical protein
MPARPQGWRSFAGAGALLGAGCAVLAAGGVARWQSLVIASVIATAAVGMTRKELPVQIASRGVAWAVFLPGALGTLLTATSGRVEPLAIALAALTGAALLLGRPMLSTREALAAFHPTRVRGAFLAACTMVATAATYVGFAALIAFRFGGLASGLALASMSGALLASAIGVVRMRAWGVFLGAATSIAASVFAAAFVSSADGVGLAVAGLPGLGLLVPVLLARLGVGEPATIGASERPTRIRIEEEASPRLRIATTALDEGIGGEEQEAATTRAARP